MSESIKGYKIERVGGAPKAAVYVRLSQQGEDEESIARQIKDGTAEVKALGFEPEVFQEPAGARSGYYEHRRPAWKQLKKRLADGDFDLVWVADLSRASRNRITVLQFIDWLQSRGVQFVSQKEQFDFSTAAGKALLGVLAVFNQFYRDDISERKKRQYASRDKTIYAANRPVLGLSRTGKYPNIEWTTNEDFPTVLEILDLYVNGSGTNVIARTLNARGRTWKYGKQRLKINPTSVLHLINGIERFRPFLDPVLFERVVAKRERSRLRRENGARTVHPRLLCHKALYCAECGERWFTSHYPPSEKARRRNWQAAYLHPGKVVCSSKRRWFLALKVDDQVWEQLESLQQVVSANMDALLAALEKGADGSRAELDAALQRQALNEELTALRRNYNRGDFGDTEDPATRSYFLREQERLLREIADLKPTARPPRLHLMRAQIEHFASVSIEAVRFSQIASPNEVNDWLRALVERIEIREGVVTVILPEELRVEEKQL